jgi:hypothetical protein
MKGVGIFFNMLEDLERFEGLTKPTATAPNGYIDWVAPIMAPDQSSVQHNRPLWAEWKKRLAPVKFLPWLWCDDPVVDIQAAGWIADNYEIDGMLFNCEKPYESAGRWKASVLVTGIMQNPKLAAKPKILSYAGIAEIQDMDWRTFERGGFTFAPQAYWLDPQNAANADAYKPFPLYKSANLPNQLHVGWDYRIQVQGIVEKHWSRIVSWDGGINTVVKDIRANKLYRMQVVPQQEGAYHYFTIAANRALLDYKTGKVIVGKMLGFQSVDKIFPTVGYYPACQPTPTQVSDELDRIKNLKGASLYLGETSQSEHVKAIWSAIQ